MKLIERILHHPVHVVRVVLAVFLVGWTQPCRANSKFLIDTWTPYEGLPQSHVLSIAQTPDGYLWVSTQLGWLARFDGISFTPFNSQNTAALNSPEIVKLLVDDRGALWISDIDGRLISRTGDKFVNHTGDKPGYDKRILSWLGRHGGENRFMTASGSILRLGEKPQYEADPMMPPSGEESIKQFCEDRKGTIWCRTQSGKLGIWKDGRFNRKPIPGIPDETRVYQLLRNPEGDILLATEKGVWINNGVVVSRAFPGLPEGGPADQPILQIARNPDNSYWLLGRASLTLVREDTVIHSTPLTGIDDTQRMRADELFADSSGWAWVIKAGAGVWQVDGQGKLFFLSTSNGLPSNLIESWFEDREKNVWLGTAGGLVRLRSRWFQNIDAQTSGPDSGITSVAEDADGAVWLGRVNGLTRWNNDLAENIPLPPVRPNFPIAEVTVCPGEFPGEVWFGTVQSGAMLLRDGKIEHPFPFAAPGMAIRVIRRDPLGRIWFGSEFGLFRWDGKQLRKFGTQDGLNPGHIHDIAFDSHGNAWIAKAYDILTVYRNDRFENVPLPGVPPSLRVNTVHCGSDGNVWVGTVGGGLLHLTNGHLFRYTTDDGLPANSITQLLEDDEGFLWGGTHRGIFRASTTAMDMHAKGVTTPVLFQNYGHTDGLPTAECPGGLQPACWKARDGRLWFSTSANAVVVDPKQVRRNLFPPTVIIEEMRVNDKACGFERGNPDPSDLTIAPGKHRFEFTFTGLSLTAPEKVRFQWRMSGVDNGWVDGRRQRNVAYNGLNPGNYQFEVRACNSDGVWSPTEASVHFRVAPHFWQRPSVWLAAAVATLGLVVLFIFLVMRRRHFRELRHLEYERGLEQQRFRHKQAMEAERARIAAELHDDLGANLTQIQWLGEAANRARQPASGESELLLRISRKSREMVRLIDQIVWAVNPKNDTLQQLVTYVCNFAEQYFRDSETRCRIDVADNVPSFPLKADVRHHLFLIAKEALHNVAKHAGTDRVWIRVTCDESVFRLVVEDRGRGMNPTGENGGDGLANMRQRAKQAGAELDIDSSPGNGTRVTLILQLDKLSS